MEISLATLACILTMILAGIGLATRKSVLEIIIFTYILGSAPLLILGTAYIVTESSDFLIFALGLLTFNSTGLALGLALNAKLIQNFHSADLDFYRILRG